jgi:hypothetical protein
MSGLPARTVPERRREVSAGMIFIGYRFIVHDISDGG